MTASNLRAAATGEKPTETRTIVQLLNDPRVGKGLAAVAGKFMTADRMLRLCINAVKKTPRLLECDPQTVLGAMMTSAALGLEPNTVQQQAFLIPYKRRAKVRGEWVDIYDCQFQVGARGYVTLAYRSPYIASLDASAIHDGDHWKHMRGTGAFLEYAIELRNRGPLIGAFSYVRLKEGGESAVVLPLDELMKIRDKSETWRAVNLAVSRAENVKDREKAERNLAETPWRMWEDDMAKKSAIKKHAKDLPIAAGDQFAAAANIDEQAESGVMDLGAMVDPDRAREAAEDADAVPMLENQPADTLEISGEAFGATSRQSEPVRAPSPAPAAKPAAKRAAPVQKSAAEPSAARAASAAVVAEYLDQIDKLDRDGSSQALDLARTDLNESQYDQVLQAFRARFPN